MNLKYEQFKQQLLQKKIAIIGAGVSNLPLIKLLQELNCDITVFDQKEFSQMNSSTAQFLIEANIPTSLGDSYLEQLVGFDIIFRSPSLLPTNPYLKEEQSRGALITTEVEQVIQLAPCPVIGITGSKGKTTTTTILYHLLRGLGYQVFLGGNIGTPLFSKIEEMTSHHLVILELSSFQLMNMMVSPHISVITNLSPDHLDVHSSYEEYIEAKKYIFLNQSKDDILVLNGNDEIVKRFAKEARGHVRYFQNITNQQTDTSNCTGYVLNGKVIEYHGLPVIDTKKLLLKGDHNYLNICAALTAIQDYIPAGDTKLEEILAKITSVAHRLEFVRELNGVKWYNDSASTSPDKSIAGIYAFDEDIVLIAGGYDKNISYQPLAKPILDKVSKLILFGDTKEKINREVLALCQKTGREIPIYIRNTLEEVVDTAKEVSISGEVVLFSPASASFDMFQNAYQRGDLYKNLVEKL